MCVLTFVPHKDGTYTFTSNRDESTLREKAIAPKFYKVNEQSILYPKDPLSEGTWVATNNNTFICLLNGGLKKHKPEPPYRHSRGNVIIDYFSYNDPKRFYADYNFTNIEPFTLIIFNNETTTLSKITNDGIKQYYEALDPKKPHIWSSVTLYSNEIIEQRNQWFSEFLANEEATADNILHFHSTAGKSDPTNALLVKRNNLVTQSITQVCINKEGVKLFYKDLLRSLIRRFRIIN